MRGQIGPCEGRRASLGGQFPAGRRATGAGRALSRRKIFKRAVGVAAVGAGGTVLAQAVASPALAAGGLRLPGRPRRSSRQPWRPPSSSSPTRRRSPSTPPSAMISARQSPGTAPWPTRPIRRMGRRSPSRSLRALAGRSRSPGAAVTNFRPCRSPLSAPRRADRPARFHLQRGQGQMATCRLRGRVQFHDHYPAEGHLPAVPVG